MLGLLFLSVFTAWKTSTTLCLLDISHTMLLAQKTPLRPPPFLHKHRQELRILPPLGNDRCLKGEGGRRRELTDSAQWSSPRPPPPHAATGPPVGSASGRSAWRRARLCVPPSPDTGTDGPSGSLPEAEATQQVGYYIYYICTWASARTACRRTDPGEVADSEQATDDVTVHRAGHAFHLHGTITQHPFFWPVLRTALKTAEGVG